MTNAASVRVVHNFFDIDDILVRFMFVCVGTRPHSLYHEVNNDVKWMHSLRFSINLSLALTITTVRSSVDHLVIGSWRKKSCRVCLSNLDYACNLDMYAVSLGAKIGL